MPRITAAVAVGANQPFEFHEFELAEPEGEEILVRTVATGICHTDLLVRDGIFGPPVPIIPGHEGAGIVEAVGEAVRSVKVGDHVVMTQASCGGCGPCRSAHPMNCDDTVRYNYTGKRASGKAAIDNPAVAANFVGQSAFATHVLAVESNAVAIAKDYPLELAAPLGCGLATGAGTVFNVLRPAPGSSLVVYGCGAVGLAAIMAARVAACAPIVAIDLSAERLAVARAVGATHLIDARTPDIMAQVAELTGGGAEYGVDAVGTRTTVRHAIESVRPGGTTVLLGANEIGSDIEIGLATLILNRTVRGAIIGDQVPQILIPKLIELARAGEFPYSTFTRTYPFRDINRAVEDTERGEVVKAIVTFG